MSGKQPLAATKKPSHDANCLTACCAGTGRRSILAHGIVMLCRFGLAGIFLWSGIAKTLNPAAFLTSIEGFQILPYSWAWLASITLPWLEICTAVALLPGGNWTRAGALVSTAMMAGFIGGIVSAWARGLEINCGCFGQSDEPSNYPWLVIRNSLLLAASVFVFSRGEACKESSPKCKISQKVAKTA